MFLLLFIIPHYKEEFQGVTCHFDSDKRWKLEISDQCLERENKR